MNFIGFHTYPYRSRQRSGSNEPTVWVGPREDVNADGTVRRSYPSAYANTLRGQWGSTPMNTSRFSCGAAQLFDAECYGSPVQRGFCPFPSTPDGMNAVFDRTAAMLREAFTYARQAGVKTCVGTETPVSVPPTASAQVADGRGVGLGGG